MPQIFIYTLLIISALSFSSCQSGEEGKANSELSHSPFIKVDGRVFRDEHNREIILNGINLIVKDADQAYVCAIPEEDFILARQWGFNVIRLGIIWDGLEPEPGVYSEEMFTCLDERIQWAKENGLYVLLDMHQDLYSRQFSDGAPAWATLTEDQPHQTGSVWSDAYLISPAVQTAFDNFWKNTPAADGVGIQDHYAQLWRKIAERYADEPAVLGYDLMNEPFVGTEAQAFFPAMLEAYMEIFYEDLQEAGMGPQQLAEMWGHPEGKAQILENLMDTAIYSRVIGAVREMNQAFESTVLMEMYARVGAAIREVDTNHIIFVEHSYFSNPGVPSGIKRIEYEDGSLEEKMAYAPHGYDLLVDTRAYVNASRDRVEFLFDLTHQTARELNMPMLVGEWGAFHGMDSSYVTQARYILDKFEEYKSSQTFWARYQGMEDHPYFNELIRPRPVAVAGDIMSFGYDPDLKVFTCRWRERESCQQPSSFFLPGVSNADALDIKLSPKGNGFEMKFSEEIPGLILSIDASGEETYRELAITF
jgi:endoglycosylceramidase